MTSININIYIEGGGQTTPEKKLLRVGFKALLQRQAEAARQKGVELNPIPCGDRNTTHKLFRQEVAQFPDNKVAILLVDSEGPIVDEVAGDPSRNAQLRKEYLGQTEPSWNLKGISPEHVHLMVQCMEAWIVADPESLAGFYGKDFHGKALPDRRNLEEEPKAGLYEKLKKATGICQKGEYAKIKHASKLLALISPAKVAERCPRFKTFTDWLSARIDAA